MRERETEQRERKSSSSLPEGATADSRIKRRGKVPTRFNRGSRLESCRHEKAEGDGSQEREAKVWGQENSPSRQGCQMPGTSFSKDKRSDAIYERWFNQGSHLE